MSHHTNDSPFGEDPERSEESKIRYQQLRSKLLSTAGFRGAIGSFPDGQLTPNDEGAIQFGLQALDGKVIIDFGTPVRSLGMKPQEAADFASDIMKLARAAALKNGDVVSFKL